MKPRVIKIVEPKNITATSIMLGKKGMQIPVVNASGMQLFRNLLGAILKRK